MNLGTPSWLPVGSARAASRQLPFAARRATRLLHILSATALTLSGAGHALAQEVYPSRTITVVVPQAASGGMDSVARAVATKMSSLLNTSFVVENKPGAGGNIGGLQVAKAAPDGYTLLMGQTSQFAINPHMYASMPFDPLKDLVPVVMLANAPNVIVVGADSPYRTLGDIVAAGKASKDLLDFATPGPGTPSHLIGEMFQKVAGVKFVHVPYKGAPQAITDTIGGRVAFMMSSIPSSLSQVKTGRLRAIAVSSDKRSPSMPNVPTIAEAGYPGFNAGTWYGLFVPAKTPAAVIQKINETANAALAAEEVVARIQSDGGTILGGTKEVFAEKIRYDHAELGKAVRDSGAKIE